MADFGDVKFLRTSAAAHSQTFGKLSDPVDGAVMAVKVLREGGREDPYFLESFRRGSYRNEEYSLNIMFLEW